MEVKGMVDGLTNIMEFLDEDDAPNRSHLRRLIKLLENEDFPRIWALGTDEVSKFYLRICLIKNDLRNMTF